MTDRRGTRPGTAHPADRPDIEGTQVANHGRVTDLRDAVAAIAGTRVDDSRYEKPGLVVRPECVGGDQRRPGEGADRQQVGHDVYCEPSPWTKVNPVLP